MIDHPWRIHGAGIYANIKWGILMGSMLPYIYIAYMDPMGHGQSYKHGWFLGPSALGNLHISKEVATWKHETTEFVNCHGFLHGLVSDSLWIRYYWKVDGPCIPKCQLHFQHVMSLYDIYIYIHMIKSMCSCIGFNTLKKCQVLLTVRNLWSIHVCDSFPWLFWFPVTQPWQTIAESPWAP